MELIAGLDIGGTKISALLIDDDGAVAARGSMPAPAAVGGAAMADAAAALVSSLAGGVPGTVVAVGAGAAGVIDSDRGVVRAASALFAGWAGFALADELAARLGVPARIENDVNAFLVGEATSGVPRRDVLGLMLGTGVGGAVILDGELRHGPHGAAGEIGHTPGYGDATCTCGQVGHLETVASGTSIAARYARRTGRAVGDARAVAALARAGDQDARAVFDDAGRAVALAGATAAGLLDLTHVIVGGGVSHAWDLLAPAISATLATDSPVSGIPLTVERAKLGSDAVALGAVAAARHHLTPVPARSE